MHSPWSFLRGRIAARAAIGLGFLAATSLPTHALEVTPDPAFSVPPGYTLAWSDEFADSALDLSKWAYRTDSKAWSTQKPENVSLSGGFLHLSLKKEPAEGKNYTGAGIISKQSFRFGFYQARCRIPAGAGWHNSFWMMDYDPAVGANPDHIGSRASSITQELDALENDSSHLNDYEVNYHKWISPHREIGHKVVQTPVLSADFHVWGCEFTPETVRYYFDGQIVQSVDVSGLPQGDQRIWLTSIARSPLGGATPVDDSKLPGEFVVDWVRYYRHE